MTKCDKLFEIWTKIFLISTNFVLQECKEQKQFSRSMDLRVSRSKMNFNLNFFSTLVL